MPGSIPLVWHVGHPNFGDDFNPHLFQKIIGSPVYKEKSNASHILGAGSILNAGNKNSIIVGSGVMSNEKAPSHSFGGIISLRGELTKKWAGIKEDIWLGDPFVLYPLLFPFETEAKKFQCGFIPHISYFRYKKTQYDLGKDTLVIDMGMPFDRLIEAMMSCEYIISQALHGLIMADTLNIPNIWLSPSESMHGGEFKFHDYYSTTDTPKSPMSFEQEMDETIEKFEPFVSNYLFDKTEYLNYLRKSINEYFK